MPETKPIAFRIDIDDADRLEKLADENDKTVAKYVKDVVTSHVTSGNKLSDTSKAEAVHTARRIDDSLEQMRLDVDNILFNLDPNESIDTSNVTLNDGGRSVPDSENIDSVLDQSIDSSDGDNDVTSEDTSDNEQIDVSEGECEDCASSWIVCEEHEQESE